MSRKATDRVTTIGIDIDKNGFHLIGLDGRIGSQADSDGCRQLCPLSGVKQTKITAQPKVCL